MKAQEGVQRQTGVWSVHTHQLQHVLILTELFCLFYYVTATKANIVNIRIQLQF